MFRLILFAGILMAEYLGLSLAYDVENVADSPQWAYLRYAGYVTPWVVLSSIWLLVCQLPALPPHILPKIKTYVLLIHGAGYGLLFFLAPWVIHNPTPYTMSAWLGGLALSVGLLLEALLSIAVAIEWLRCWTLSRLLLGLYGTLICGLSLLAGRYLAHYGWQALSSATLMGAAGLLRGSGDMTLDADQQLLGLDGFVVKVSWVCSGIEGLALVAIVLPAFIIYYRHIWISLWVWLTVPLALFAMFLANIFRIAALVWLGANIDPDIALGGFHSKAGWVLFCAVIAASAYLAWQAFSQQEELQNDHRLAFRDLPEAPYIVPLLVSQSASLLLGLWVADFPSTLPLTVLLSLGGIVWSVRAWLHQQHHRSSAQAAATTDVSTDKAGETRRWDILRQELSFSKADILISIGGGLAVYLLWLVLMPNKDIERVTHLRGVLFSMTPVGYGLWILSRSLASIVAAPLIEEWLFRGYLMRRWMHEEFTQVNYQSISLPALVFSSLAFAALHSAFVAAVVAGLVYGGLAWHTNRLQVPVIAHAITNFLIAGNVLIGGRWDLWL